MLGDLFVQLGLLYFKLVYFVIIQLFVDFALFELLFEIGDVDWICALNETSLEFCIFFFETSNPLHSLLLYC